MAVMANKMRSEPHSAKMKLSHHLATNFPSRNSLIADLNPAVKVDYCKVTLSRKKTLAVVNGWRAWIVTVVAVEPT